MELQVVAAPIHIGIEYAIISRAFHTPHLETGHPQRCTHVEQQAQAPAYSNYMGRHFEVNGRQDMAPGVLG